MEANSLLASLNARRDLRDDYSPNAHPILPINSVRLDQVQEFRHNEQEPTAFIDIHPRYNSSIRDTSDAEATRDSGTVTENSRVEPG